MWEAICRSVLDLARVVAEKKELPAGYRPDGFSFELAAYLVFRVDVYLFSSYPRVRQGVINRLHEQTALLFSDLFGMSDDELCNLLDRRMNFYAPLVRHGAEPQTVHTMVMQVVHHTAKNGGVPRGDAGEGLTVASALDEFAIKTLLLGWEMRSVGRLHALIDDFYGSEAEVGDVAYPFDVDAG